ncbi:hypothetical protein [Propionivibrio limicola]|nr:hypothetical protein [Propionivibrio limicola]
MMFSVVGDMKALWQGLACSVISARHAGGRGGNYPSLAGPNGLERPPNSR